MISVADSDESIMGRGRFIGVLLGAGAAALAVHAAMPWFRSRHAIGPAPPFQIPVPPPPPPNPLGQPTMTTPTTYGVAQPRGSDLTTPSVLRWAGAFGPAAAAAGVPLEFVQAWNAIESGGYPGSIGSPGAKGPDGYPQEVGLLQLYNPDDFTALGFTPAQLLAAQPDAAAKMYLQFVLLKKRQADHNLAAANIAWPTSSPDYWTAVKFEHASVAYPPKMFAQVIAKLARPPRSWREFRNTYELLNPASKFNPAAKPGDQNYFFKIMDNAEWTGFHVPPTSQAVA